MSRLSASPVWVRSFLGGFIVTAVAWAGCGPPAPPPAQEPTPPAPKQEATAPAAPAPVIERAAQERPAVAPAAQASSSPPRRNETPPRKEASASVAPPPVRNVSFQADGTSGDWSCFRGPGGMGVAQAKDLPLQWSLEENVAWKTPLPGPGASSPTVFGERIYLTCFTGYLAEEGNEGSLENLKRHLLALNRADGKLVWDQAVAAKLPEEQRIRDHGFAANTPAVDADRIYVFFGKSGVFAFDHSGKQLWQTDVGDGTNGWGTAASPVLYKDLVFINASVESQSLIALERATGKERWRALGMRESWNTPVVIRADSGREELIVTVMGKVLAFDPLTGEELWSCKTDIGWYMVPSVVAADGVVYCLGGRSGIAALAVRAGGSGDVTKTHRLWTSMKGSNVTSPVFHEGHLYWMHEQRGIAYCAKADSGEVVYEERLDRAGQVYSSSILANGRVYYLTRDGRTFVLAARPQFEQLAVNDLRDRSIFNGSPAVDGSRILIRSDKFLYCLGK